MKLRERSVFPNNGLPSVIGKDGICKALAKITDCVIRKRLSVSCWMAASSQKMMSHLETIREYKHPVREVRKDSRRAGLAEEAVQKWQHGDDSPASFTNCDKSRNTANVNEKFPPRVWEGIVTNIDKWRAFLGSDEYDEFFGTHQLTIGFTIFCESLCKCTKVPMMESCVDTNISGGEESLRKMNNVLRDPTLRKIFDECDCEYHSRFKESQRNETDDVSYPLDLDAKNSTNIYDFICKTCCEPVPDPDLVCDSDYVPKYVPLKFVYAKEGDKKCEHCGIRKHYEDLDKCPVWKSENMHSRTFKCSKWEKAKIKESDKKSKEQWTLITYDDMRTASDILSLFEKQLECLREHYVTFKWSDHQRKLHQVMVDPDRVITIATDFGSIMDMTAKSVDNQHIPLSRPHSVGIYRRL